MRHARDGDLDRLDTVLDQLRQLPGLSEKKRGTFYRRGRAFLHFHADGPDDELYADVRLEGDEFERFPATTAEEQQRVVDFVTAALGPA